MTGNAASSGSRGIPQLFGVRLSLSAAFGRLTCHAARQFVFLLYNGIRPNYSAQTLLGVFSPPLRICTMRPLIVPACITLFAGFAGAASYDVRYGSFEAPDDFVFKHTGTLDSFRGTLTRKSDGFTISFDIGLMAGTHMYPSKQDECTFFSHAYDQRQLCLDGHRARRRQTDSYDNHLRAWRAFSTVGRGGQRLTQASRGRT